jgi:hypothetical protein
VVPRTSLANEIRVICVKITFTGEMRMIGTMAPPLNSKYNSHVYESSGSRSLAQAE